MAAGNLSTAKRRTLAMNVDSARANPDYCGVPRGIDVIGESSPNKGQRLPAIYRYKGSEMEICYDLSGKERPTEFVSKANTQLFRITYKCGK